MITPQSAAAYFARAHRAVDGTTPSGQQFGTSPPKTAEVLAYRALARRLGNEAVDARKRASAARRAAAEERRKAQAARVLVAQAADPEGAADARKRVAAHVALAQRYAAEAAELAALAAHKRAELVRHRAASPSMLARPPEAARAGGAPRGSRDGPIARE